MCSSRPIRTTSPLVRGLIASLRELGQNVTIITVFWAMERTTGLRPTSARHSGLGRRRWPSTEAFNRSAILPDYAIGPAWVADEVALEATQVDADQAAKRFGAIVLVSASEHPQRVARRPAGVIDDLLPSRARC